MTTTLERGAQAAGELFHYGKKGMKWGVRNDKGHEGEQVKTKKLDKLDKQWEKENTGQKGFIKAHNAMADRMNNGMIDNHNNDPRWKDVDLADPKNADLEKTYMDEFFKLSDKVFHEETVKLGMNPSGSKAYEMRQDDEGNDYAYLAPVKQDVKHAEGDVETVFKINRDVKGFITSLTETSVELKHYGKKGMKWGVTTVDKASKPTIVREGKSKDAKDISVTQRKPGKYVKTKGGQRHKATEDAVKAAAARQKAKKSTTDSLSNDELKAAVERMNLEQQFKKLDAKTKRRGQGFVSQLFMSPEARALAVDMKKEINKKNA